VKVAADYGVAFCASGGVAITPSLSSGPEPSATLIADSTSGLGLIPGESSAGVATDVASSSEAVSE
jgi:hypothetical protein